MKTKPEANKKETGKGAKKNTKKNLFDPKRVNKGREVLELTKKLEKLTPSRGSNPFKKASKDSEQQKPGEYAQFTKFTELPISFITKRGLSEAKFTTMTEIQRASLLYSLSGSDILGSSGPGSGKTLAFVIPVIENLYRNRWTPQHGLGAVILTPSHELSLQIFEVLRTIGKYHGFSAGLIMGKLNKFKDEQAAISRLNILISTPGRLLQHMDETPSFHADNLKILVLDEADLLLEMGFEQTLEKIIQFLPKARQTLLFSATQAKSVKKLAIFSLDQEKTESISVITPMLAKKDEKSEEKGEKRENDGTIDNKKLILKPEFDISEKLTQLYMVSEIYEKLDILYSFLTTHPKEKSIVFCTSSKEVMFLEEVFFRIAKDKFGRDIQFHISRITSKMTQKSRNDNFENFMKAKYGVLFTTDISARGLDFPNVTFVFQLDLPVDLKAYIHRAGRTARNGKEGKSIIFLSPQEKPGFLEIATKYAKNSIADRLKEMKVNPKKMYSFKDQFAAINSSDTNVKFNCLCYYENYVKHFYKKFSMVDVKIEDLNLNEFALRIGLPGKPQINLEDETNLYDADGSGKMNKNKKSKNKTPTNVSKRSMVEEEDPEEEEDEDMSEDDEEPIAEEEEEDDEKPIEEDDDDEKPIEEDDDDDEEPIAAEDDDEEPIEEEDDDDEEPIEEEEEEDSDSDLDAPIKLTAEEIKQLLRKDSDKDQTKKRPRNNANDRYINRAPENEKTLTAKYESFNLTSLSDDEEEDEKGEEENVDFFKTVRENHEVDEKTEKTSENPKKRIRVRADSQKTDVKHVFFDTEGDKKKVVSRFEKIATPVQPDLLENNEQQQFDFLKQLRKKISSVDVEDREKERELRRKIKRERKIKEKEGEAALKNTQKKPMKPKTQ